MKFAAALLLALAVALMGGARTAGAWSAGHQAHATHHADAARDHAHDHQTHGHHAHSHHAHGHQAHGHQAHDHQSHDRHALTSQDPGCAQTVTAEEGSDDGARHGTCCAFACHAIAAQAASALVFPARAANGLSPADAPLLRGGAPPGFDRPPRLA